MTTRIDMTKTKLADVRNSQVQLLAQLLQAFRAEIVLTGRKTSMGPEEPELEGNPDPAAEIEALNKPHIVEIQAPAFQKGTIRHVHLPQAKMLDHRSTEGWRQRCICTRYVLQDVHICSFGPFRPFSTRRHRLASADTARSRGNRTRSSRRVRASGQSRSARNHRTTDRHRSASSPSRSDHTPDR